MTWAWSLFAGVCTRIVAHLQVVARVVCHGRSPGSIKWIQLMSPRLLCTMLVAAVTTAVIPELSQCGCAAQKTLLCLELDICCKTRTPCLCCGCCAFRCVDLTTCCKVQSQFFCCVGGSAFPSRRFSPVHVECMLPEPIPQDRLLCEAG